MCLCYLFSAKTVRQLVNRKADFFTKRIDSNRELECSTRYTVLVVSRTLFPRGIAADIWRSRADRRVGGRQ